MDPIRLRYPRKRQAQFATVAIDIWRDVRPLPLPILFLRGKHSKTFRPEIQARLARQMPEARVAHVAGAGHRLSMEKPAEIGAAISAFLIET